MIRTANIEMPVPPKLNDKEETVRVQLVVNKGWIARINEWRRMQPDMPNLSEAIRRLVEIALSKKS